uniref:UPAR/Ly6 domain-containing protein n=1 Tax=Sphenodon punctatus TaxID=8508 RepID=A0A8D0HIM1_SPHPU
MEGKPNNSVSFTSNGQMVTLAEEYCSTTLCNKVAPSVLDSLGARSRGHKRMECYSCSATDGSCSSSTLPQIRCLNPKDHCVDITALSASEEFPQDERYIKGCGRLSHCQEPLGFHNENSFYLLKCCNSSLCNNETRDYLESPLPPNGMMCYSCEGNSSQGCAPQNITLVQCQGPMTQCMEAVGIHNLYGPNTVLKGCASPSWCDAPYTSIYKHLSGIHSRCCTGDRCNNWVSSGTLNPFRRSRASPGIRALSGLPSTVLLLLGALLLSMEGS